MVTIEIKIDLGGDFTLVGMDYTVQPGKGENPVFVQEGIAAARVIRAASEEITKMVTEVEVLKSKHEQQETQNKLSKFFGVNKDE